MRDWLRQILTESGWTLADRELDHQAAARCGEPSVKRVLERLDQE